MTSRSRSWPSGRAAWLIHVALACALAACSDASTSVIKKPPLDEVPLPPAPVCVGLDEVCAVPLPTYDGSNQVVHPDVVVFPNGFAGHDFWLAATPYPNGDANFENPSLYTDADQRWAVPADVTNPIVPAPASPAHNSDPDISFDPEANQLRLYYRLTSNGRDQVLLLTSADGERWSDPTSVVAADGISIVSPAIVRLGDGSWSMWSVNAVNGGCTATSTVIERRTSRDGLQWSPPSPVSITQPGYVLWHLDVQYIPSKHEFWALIAAYPRNAACAADDLFFARSADGTTWQTYPAPLVARGDFPPYANAVYRSTFEYDAEHDAIRLWLSGAVFRDGSWRWTAATSRWRMTDLMRRITTATPASPVATQPTTWNQPATDASQSDFP